MARAALGLGVRDVGKLADVAPNTVNRFENGSDIRLSTLSKIKNVLEAEGIEFIPEDDSGGAGVRFRKPNNNPAGTSS